MKRLDTQEFFKKISLNSQSKNERERKRKIIPGYQKIVDRILINIHVVWPVYDLIRYVDFEQSAYRVYIFDMLFITGKECCD